MLLHHIRARLISVQQHRPIRIADVMAQLLINSMPCLLPSAAYTYGTAEEESPERQAAVGGLT